MILTSNTSCTLRKILHSFYLDKIVRDLLEIHREILRNMQHVRNYEKYSLGNWFVILVDRVFVKFPGSVFVPKCLIDYIYNITIREDSLEAV